MSLEPKETIPFEMDASIPQQPLSAGAGIDSSKYKEIYPSSSASTYSFSTTRELTFDLKDNKRFADMGSHYLRFDVACTLLAGGLDDATKSLATGGSHALFSRVEVLLDNGNVEIQHLDNYNRLNAVLGGAQHPDYVETIGASYGDSLNDTLIEPYGSIAAGSGVDSARKWVANNNVKICMQVEVPFFKMGQYIPLPFIQNGMRLRMFMERPEFVLQSRAAASPTFTLADCVISNARLLVRMVEPAQHILQSYQQVFSSTGLVYNYVDYWYSSDAIAGSSTGQSMIPLRRSLASVRSAYSVIQNLKGATLTASTGINRNLSTYGHDSIGTFVKAFLSAYSYSIGSEYWPYQSEVDMLTADNSEALRMYLDARGMEGGKQMSLREPIHKWSERVADGVAENESGQVDSTKLVLAARFSRYPQDSWSGVDGRSNPMNLNVSFSAPYLLNATATDRYFRTWIEFDRSLILHMNSIAPRL